MRIFFFLICVYGTLIAQNENNPNLILSYSENKELSFHKYDPPLVLKATIESKFNVKNEYPEELMHSILSATNQEWVDYNHLDKQEEKKPSHFDKILSMDKDKNYFELHHKLAFTLGEIPTAIIKFYFYQENEKPLSAAYVMQKIDGRWQRTSHPSLSIFTIIVMRMKSEVLEGIILGNSDNSNIQAITQRVTTDGSLDLKKLEDEFASWYDPQIDQFKINLYKDPNAW